MRLGRDHHRRHHRRRPGGRGARRRPATAPATGSSPPPASPPPAWPGSSGCCRERRLLPADRGARRRRPAADRRARRRARPVWSAAWSRPGRSARARSSRTPPAPTASTCWRRPPRSAAHPLALHPAMTFTGTAGDLDRLGPASRSGSPRRTELRPLATRLVADLGGSVEWVAEAARAALPRRPGPRRQPSGHPGQRGDGPAARRRRGPPGAGARRRCCGASLENTLRARRRGADRAGRPRRRRHDRPAPGRAARRSRRTRCRPTWRWPAARADRAIASGRLRPARRRAAARRARAARPAVAEVSAHDASAERRATSRSSRPGPSWPRCGPRWRAGSAVVMTMGALHEGHAALLRAARARGRPRAGHDLRQPAAVRAERGLHPLPAHPRRRPGGAAGGAASTPCSCPARGGDLPATASRGYGWIPVRLGDGAGGRAPARVTSTAC